MKILMVCLGNICRSPLAEGIMRQKVTERGLNWEVDSAGTGFWHIGEPPDSRSIQTARKYGLDITTQRARQISAQDLARFDLILTMDESNYRDVLRLAKPQHQEDKVAMILDYAHPGKNLSVPDPYWDDDGFDQIYQMLTEACERVIDAHSQG
ncbi:MAG: low molecular weight phosphotyrosine protein phosphatase [Phaeodactylibacter sp.]|nr:low molecular weight phosphotyrosine protein phosphatase [Phaeodactylibacter sp.]MCB9272527.1 low molecular weight phosphotyrosine protein phosphatase [Lewinellaceae bacterium]